VAFQTVFKGIKRQIVLMVRGWKERNGTLSGWAIRFLNRIGILRTPAEKSTA
jgi:hypothetical protein